MLKFSDRFEVIISKVLLCFAMVIIAYQTIQLIWNTFEAFYIRFREVGLEYAPEYSKDIAIMFFNILLMLEIMQTLKVFAWDHITKLKVILIVCLIAASRKILALGEHNTDPMLEIAIATLILALAIGFHLVSRYNGDKFGHDEHKQ
jgi:uncharacterized membrane protein (DUF373 family)